MSEIAALQATDRARPLPAGLRAHAFALMMEIPEDVQELPTAEADARLPNSVRSNAYATLMHAQVQVPARRRIRPLWAAIAAAAVAIALPVGAAIMAIQSGPSRPPGIAIRPTPTVKGTVTIRPPSKPPATVKKPVLQEPKQPTKGRAVVNRPPQTRPKGTPANKARAPRAKPKKQPPPAKKDLVPAALESVNQLTKSVTTLVSDLTGGAVDLSAEKNSLPLLGSPG